MPVYAFLVLDQLECPQCHMELRAKDQRSWLVAFQWGYCPSQWPSEVEYRLGDPIVWRSSRDGIVRGWASFGNGTKFNIGDPEVRSLIVVAIDGMASQLPESCPGCGCGFDGVAIRIDENVIASAWLIYNAVLLPGQKLAAYTWGAKGTTIAAEADPSDLSQSVTCYTLQPDQGWVPQFAWEGLTCQEDVNQ